MGGKRLSFERHEGGYRHVDDQHKRSEPGEQPQYHQNRTKYFSKDAKYQGNAVTDMEQVKEAVFVIAEMGDFIQAVIDQKHEPKGEAQSQGGDVESAFRISR